MPLRRLFVAIAAITMVASGCGHDLQFRSDHRLHIESPRPRTIVTLPVTLTWRYDGTERDRGFFGVFVDRAPMPASKDLHWLARGDRTCHPDAGCPDTSYLAKRRIFTTTQRRLRFEQLPLPAFHKGLEDHTVAVVLLDGQGRRIGESAWYVNFRLRRHG